VWIHLTHNESVDVEELTHPIERQITGHTSVNKFIISLELGHKVRFDSSILFFDHYFDAVKAAWNSATGNDGRPNHHVWSC
jgi:hypothetical protein